MSKLANPKTFQRFSGLLDEGVNRCVDVIVETLTRLHVPCDDVLTARVREMAYGFGADVMENDRIERIDRLHNAEPLVAGTTDAIHRLIRELNPQARALTGNGDTALRVGIDLGLNRVVERALAARILVLKAALDVKRKAGE